MNRFSGEKLGGCFFCGLGKTKNKSIFFRGSSKVISDFPIFSTKLAR
jgi:hypothetical protein